MSDERDQPNSSKQPPEPAAGHPQQPDPPMSESEDTAEGVADPLPDSGVLPAHIMDDAHKAASDKNFAEERLAQGYKGSAFESRIKGTRTIHTRDVESSDTPQQKYRRGLQNLRVRLEDCRPGETIEQREAIDQLETLMVNLQDTLTSMDAGDTTQLTNARNTAIRAMQSPLTVLHLPSFEVLCQRRAAQRSNENRLLATEEDVRIWYADELIKNHEILCFSVAAWILNGAPVTSVSSASDTLLEYIESALPPNTPLPMRSNTQYADILGQTYTSIDHETGGLYWETEEMAQPVDQIFAIQTLSTGIMFGHKKLLDILEEWAVGVDEERARFACRTLVKILWGDQRKQQGAKRPGNHEHLHKLASRWGSSGDYQQMQSAADIVIGALEKEMSGRPASELASAEVMRWLRTWSNWRIRDKDDWWPWLATIIYGYVGKKWPVYALSALADLMQISPGHLAGERPLPPFEISLAGFESCQEIIEDGNLRHLLRTLAKSAEYLAGQPTTSVSGRREDQLDLASRLLFDLIFYLTSVLSLSAVGPVHAAYRVDEQLAEKVPFPDLKGRRDAILIGIIVAQQEHGSGEDAIHGGWQDYVVKILGSAIVKKRHVLAFALMKAWGEIVLTVPSDAVYDRYVRFIAEVGQWVKKWVGNQRMTGQHTPFSVFDGQLRKWTIPAKQVTGMNKLGSDAWKVLHGTALL